MIRLLALVTALTVLVGCANPNQDKPPSDLGDFQLGYNVVIASKMQKGPISRNATPEEWVDVLTSAVDQRFGGFEGDKLYHFGISVEGYMLAPPGVPVIYNPRSMLLLNITVWDDAAKKKLNDKPFQITVVEDSTADSFVMGSGRERTKEEQMQGLAANAMDQIGDWLVEQKKEAGWFETPAPG